MLYLSIKLLHILSAIISIGSNISYAMWIYKGNKEKEHFLFTLKGIFFLDSYIANPFYFIALITGFIMIYLSTGNIKPFSWNLYGLIIFSLMGFLAFFFYTPLLKKQISLVEENKIESIEYQEVNRKQNIIGFILTFMSIIILALMVFKPSL